MAVIVSSHGSFVLRPSTKVPNPRRKSISRMRDRPAGYDLCRQVECEGWDVDAVPPYFRRAGDDLRNTLCIYERSRDMLLSTLARSWPKRSPKRRAVRAEPARHGGDRRVVGRCVHRGDPALERPDIRITMSA